MKIKIFIKVCGAVLVIGGLMLFGQSAKAENKIYISQVQITGGTGKTDNDFVEIYNPSDAPFNLKGYRLVKRTANGTADTSIKSWTSDIFVPAKGYFLWANSNFTAISAAPDVTTTGTLANDNGVAIRLGSADTGTIIDSIAWGTTNNSFSNISSVNPAAGQSLVRQDLTVDVSAFALAAANPHSAGAAAFVGPASAATTTSPAANSGVTYSKQSSDVFISEILPNPVGEDSGQEKVELENSGGTPVDLEGWIISDKQTGSEINLNAYTIHGQSLLAGARAVITIPPGYFILANSGDTVNLYFPDKTLSDSVSFTESKEGESYQKIGEDWVWAAQSLGLRNFGETPVLAKNFQIYINEIMADPEGSDENNEWIELANNGAQTADLKGFSLDFGGNPETISPNTINLSEESLIPANGFLVVPIPEKNFELLNSGGMVKLFDAAGKLTDRIIYPAAKEGLSYSKIGQDWKFSEPSSGQSNEPKNLEKNIIISEVYPSPSSGQEEFLELQNISEGEINLKSWTIKIGSHNQKVSDDVLLAPGEFYAIYQNNLGARLRNAGDEVALLNPQGEIIDSVVYPAAKAGESYTKTADGSWGWSELSPGKANPEVLGISSTTNTELTSSTPKTKTIKTAQTSTSQADKDLVAQVAELTEAVNELKDQLNQPLAATAKAENANSANQTAPKTNFSSLVLSVGALVLLMGMVKTFFGKKGETK